MTFVWANKKNKAIKALCTGYCHYSWCDKDLFNQLLDVVQLGLTEHDYNDIKPYLTLIQHIVMKPSGDRSEGRLDRTLVLFLEMMDSNQTFYKYMETCFEFLFKLVAAVPHVFAWFTQNKDKWLWLVEWAQKVSFPVNQMDPSSNVRLYKKRNQYQQYP